MFNKNGISAWIAKSEGKKVEWKLLGLDWQELTDKEFLSWDNSRFVSENSDYLFRVVENGKMLGNYKIRVTNEAESKEAQELFFELGYYWNTGLGVKHLNCNFLYAKNKQITMGYCSDHFSENNCCEITLLQLRDMVSAHRKSTEQGLISGADAKLAWAYGEDIQYQNKLDVDSWLEIGGTNTLGIFEKPQFVFRLKPITIKLNGLYSKDDLLKLISGEFK